MADLIITFRIPEAKKNDFREGFLKICPVPTKDFAEPTAFGKLPNPPDIRPIMTEKQWVKHVARESLIDKYKQGKALLAKETAQIDDGIIEE